MKHTFHIFYLPCQPKKMSLGLGSGDNIKRNREAEKKIPSELSFTEQNLLQLNECY